MDQPDTEFYTKGVVRVLLVDDQRLMREGLRTLLELHEDLRVVGGAGDGIEAEILMDMLHPQVVLMDLRMPRRDGIEATRRIVSKWPEVAVLVLTTYDDEDLVIRSIEAGAAGYLLKDVGSDVLAEAVRAASRGESPLQPAIARKVLKRLRHQERTTHFFSGTPPIIGPVSAREKEVLQILGTGASNREIADQLSLTEGTVKNYISAILAKTGFRDRTNAALYAVRLGLTLENEP